MTRVHELGFELLPTPVYPPDLATLFSDLKKMLARKKFNTDEEEIAETRVYFESKDKSYYENDIKRLKNHYNRYIGLDGDYVECCQKMFFETIYAFQSTYYIVYSPRKSTPYSVSREDILLRA